MAVARCTVERLMQRLGLRGVIHGKVVRTTISDAKAPCPLDRVKRQFKADHPNQLWVSDFTYVSTWQGWLYVAFIIDVFARRSLALGRSEASAPVQPSYTATERLIRDFEKEFGTRDCHVLLGCDLATPEGQAMFREKKLGQQCAQYTGKAAEIAARIIEEMANPAVQGTPRDKAAQRP